MMIYYRIPPTSALLLLPLVMAVQAIFTLAISLLLAMANLFYRDVKYLFEVVLTVWMFASAIVYPLESVRGGLLGLGLSLNPMTSIVDAYRHVILYGTAPPLVSFASVTILSVVLLPAVWLLFHRSEFRFAEHI
jgi:ABC-type polysaccharide/polyol phosphate export permease